MTIGNGFCPNRSKLFPFQRLITNYLIKFKAINIMVIYKMLSVFIYIMFIPVFLFAAIIMITASLLYFPLFYKIDKICCRLIMSSLLVWPRLNGAFPSDGTYIIMMNHSSFIDVFIFPLIPKGIYSGVTAVENFKIPVFSTIIRRIQAIPV